MLLNFITTGKRLLRNVKILLALVATMLYNVDNRSVCYNLKTMATLIIK